MIGRQFGASILSSAVWFILAGCAQQGSATAAQEPAKPQMAAAPMPMTGEMAMPTTMGSLRVLSPRNGQRITTDNIPVRVAVSNFTLSRDQVGRPDVTGEGHIHVMVDGMTMGKLFNFYTAPNFTLPGRGLARGEHTLIFDLASNTHEDFGNTVQKVSINYLPRRLETLPRPVPGAAPPVVSIVSPAP
jgi:hypothetical protein